MKYFIAFVAGGALGSLATWMFVKKKYEQIAQEEIDSVKEVYSKRKPKTEKMMTMKRKTFRSMKRSHRI